MTFDTRQCGPVRLRYVALDDPSGIDARPLIETLNDVGYDGWFTVHQPLREGQQVEDAMREAMNFFSPMLGAPSGSTISGSA
jgi:sugar phosphate isomerase/epimerase